MPKTHENGANYKKYRVLTFFPKSELLTDNEHEAKTAFQQSTAKYKRIDKWSAKDGMYWLIESSITKLE